MMTHHLKALGLALFVLLAMSAVGAGAAQAQNGKFTSVNYTATIDATTTQNIGEANEYFEHIGRKLECEVAHFDGVLWEPSGLLTIKPEYTDHTYGGTCDAGGVFQVTVTENSCNYWLRTAGTSGFHYKVSIDISCPFEPMIVHVANAFGSDVCTITIGSQVTGGTLTAKQNGNHVDLSGSVFVESTLHSKSLAICGKAIGEHKGILTSYVINKPITVIGNKGKISITD